MKKIAIFGDVMLDRYWLGSTHRISPEAPVPVVNIDRTEDRLGGAANVALNISALQFPITLVGEVGEDADGKTIQSLCKAHQINAQLLHSEQRPTISKLRIISKQQHIVRCDFEEQAAALSPDFAAKRLAHCKKIIDQHDIIVLSDYAKGFLDQPQALIEYARNAGKVVIVDPKGDDFNKYRGASIITPNRSEFEAIVGHCESEESFLEAAKMLRETLALDALLVTRSEEGMTLIEEDSSTTTLPPKSLDVFDVTGAGDTVVAMIALHLAHDQPLKEACSIANTAASIVIGKMGASQVTREELAYALGQSTRAHHQVLTLDELLVEVERAKQNHEVIVMTNGCFDILHRGHVLYLEAARKLGHRLIVALNSDQSIKRLKGENRPVMDELSRATVMATLGSVDWVVLFDEDSPEKLIEAIMPDILVKGSDYQVEEIKGADIVIQNGGRVELIDLVDGYSTSNAIAKIRNTQ